MKHPSLLICLALGLGLALVAAKPSRGAAEEPVAASEIPQTAFTLLIVGTRHYADVEVMRKNVGRIPKMQRLVETVSSQNHLQFSGLYGGEVDSLIADIQGLAADRFDVQARDDKARGLVITLRKIQADQTSTP